MNTPNGTMDFEARLRLDQLEGDLERMRNAFQRSLQSAEQESNKLQQSINNVTKGFLAFLSIQQAQQFVADIVRVRSEFQKTEITFQTMLKSKEKANTLISEMVNLAAKTPFGLQDVNEGAKRLLAFQVPAEEVTETLRRMGDVAAGLGVPMGQLIHVYGQVKAQGKLMTNDLYQFMNAGIPIIAELSKVVKKSEQEIKEMVSQGKIGFGEIQQVIQNMTNQGGLFHDMNAKLSESLDGQISNLKDNFQQMMNEFGKSSEGVISDAISGVSYLVENYRTIGKVLSVLIATYGTYKTALMAQAVAQQIVTRYGQYDVATKQLQTRATIQAMFAQIKLNTAVLANPYVLAGAALVGLVVAIWQFSDGMSQAERQQKKFNDELNKLNETLEEKKRRYRELVDELENENTAETRKIEIFEQLKNQFPHIARIYENHIELIKDKTNAQKELNEEIEREKRAFVAYEYKKNSGRIERLKKEVAHLEGKGDNLSLTEKMKLDQYKKTLNSLIPFEKKFQEQIYNERKATINKLSIEEQKAYQKRIQEHAQGRVWHQEFEGLEIAKVWTLNQIINDNIKAEENKNKILDNRIQLQKELADIESRINAIQSQKAQSQTDKDSLKELKEQRTAIEKKLKEDYNISKDKSFKKSQNPKFDHEANELKIARERTDNELKAQKLHIEAMAEGYQKERALIDFHYKEKAEAIDRGLEDTIIQLKKQRKDGTITARQYDELLFQANKNYDLSHKNNKQVREQQEDKLLKNLLDKYQTFEEKKAEIAKEFDKEIAVLQKKNIDGIYDNNIKEAQKKKQEALLQAEISSSDANTAISNLFGDMSKKSIEDLEALQTAGEEAFERLKASGTLGVEALKAIEEKLKSNKKLIRDLSPIFKQLAIDFKTLNNKDASEEDKSNAFSGIVENIPKATQALVQFGDVLKDLGSNTLSQIANQLNEITQKASGYASILKSVGVGGGAALGIGAGIGVLTSVFNHFAQARRNKEEAERRWREQQIEHEKKLAELEHQRILQMKQYSNVFVQNKIGRHIEQLNEYKKGIDGLGSELRKLQNMEVWDRTERIKEWFPKWNVIYREYDKNFFKPFKEKYGEIIDDFGNINYELLEKLNPNSREFQSSFDFIDGYKEGSAKFIEELKKIQDNLAKLREELDKYVESTFGELGNNFANNIINSVQKGTNAFESFGSTVSNVMRNLINQMLITDKVKKMFDDFNKSIGDIYARNLGVDNAIVFEEVKNKTIEFVNKTLKPEIEKGEALTKNIFDELEKQGVKMYDEQTRQAKEKGFARMSQDSADELNGQFRLMTELQKQKLNVSTQILEKSKGIADSIKMLQQNSAQQLKHLAGIEVNTFQLHEMKKDIAGMKAGIDDITTKGIKIR
ncbi:tape measure protein [Capnocytophaga canimorsus]|uniref:tape measure protein n=1 Tax=Capnocytophaga canimorsus TaxID=28188 RepID=UPI00384BC1BF